jgi:hypothetical protein
LDKVVFPRIESYENLVSISWYAAVFKKQDFCSEEKTIKRLQMLAVSDQTPAAAGPGLWLAARHILRLVPCQFDQLG